MKVNAETINVLHEVTLTVLYFIADLFNWSQGWVETLQVGYFSSLTVFL